MATHSATVTWERGGQAFTDGKYSRGHTWRFDGGAEVAASASPHIVPLPYSVAENVDPEEAFIAAVSSCHMLFFLSFAQQAGLVIDSYHDEAEGIMGTHAGRTAVSHIRLRPVVVYGGTGPDRGAEAALHHKAHDACFIANSVKTHIETVLPD